MQGNFEIVSGEKRSSLFSLESEKGQKNLCGSPIKICNRKYELSFRTSSITGHVYSAVLLVCRDTVVDLIK
jgi:hypothetical protein